MFKNKKLGFDLDGPLFPFSTVCFEKINRKHQYDFGEVEFWSRKNRSNRFYGKHREEIDRIVADPRTYMEPAVHNTAKSVLNILSKEYGNEIFYVTARGENLRPITEMWLSELPNPDNLFMGYHYKVDIIRDLELDFYTDDRHNIIIDILASGLKTDARLFWADYLSYNDVIYSGLPYLLNIKELLAEEEERGVCPSCERMYLKDKNGKEFCIKCDWRDK